MQDWNTEQARYKEKERGIVEQREGAHINKKKRVKKDWKVIGPKLWDDGERVHHRAISKDLCQAWIDKESRGFWSSRNEPIETRNARLRKHKDRIAKYRIEGPDHG